MTQPMFLERQLAMGGTAADPRQTVPATLGVCRPDILHFGDAAAEYQAAKTRAAVFDVSDRRQLEFTGRDCQSLLHSLCTNDIKRLAPGAGCEAFVTTVKGRILAHVLIFVHDAGIWVDAGPLCDEAALAAHFDRYVLREDVQIHGRTTDTGMLLLTGPASDRLLTAAQLTVDTPAPWQHVSGTRDGQPFAVRRVDLLDTMGYLLSVPRTLLHRFWDDLVAAGAQPAGAEAFHALRIEAGFPLHGIDISPDNLAQEASRTDQAVSFTKGCYLGQEPIARVDAVGHINRLLCRLRIASETPPEPGDTITGRQEQAIGSITSAARVPGTGTSVALAVLRATHSYSGTQVVVQHGPTSLSAQVG